MWTVNEPTGSGQENPSSQHKEYRLTMQAHMFLVVLIRLKTTKPSPSFTFRWHIFPCLQPTGWRIFWSPVTKMWNTLAESAVRFSIPHSQVLCWPSRGFFVFVGGTENKARHDKRMLTMRNTWPNQQCLLILIRRDRIFFELVPNTRFLIPTSLDCPHYRSA